MLRKVLFSMCAVAVLALVMGTPAFAQTSDWRTFFTFNTPVTLPGLTLPAGTYLFRVADPNSSRSVVQVSSADGRHHGMFLTIPSLRSQATETPEIRFAETPSTVPPAIKTWWYPGDSTGFEFLYPEDQVRHLASSASAPVTMTASASDETLANEVGRRIRQYAFYSVFDDVEGDVHDGIVTLTGKVRMPYIAKDIGQLVAHVPGVREVDNQIQTLPVSTFDDELRVGIANRIYRNPLFWNDAIQPTPPIHVVVENGHVTLTGVVDSEVERVQAEMIARSTPGVFGVDNDLCLDHDARATN